MPILTARFKLPIDADCLLQLPDEYVAEFQITYSEFDAKVRLLPCESWRSKEKDDLNWVTSVWAVEMVGAGDDPEDVPEVIHRADGTMDLTQQGTFLNSRLDDYKLASSDF